MMAPWLLAPAFTEETCDGPHPGRRARGHRGRLRRRQPEEIAAAAVQARDLFPCVGVRLLPEEAAGIHRLSAYDTFVQRNLLGAQVWLEASRAADSG